LFFFFVAYPAYHHRHSAFQFNEADLAVQTAGNVRRTGLAFVTLWGGPNGMRGGDIEVGVCVASISCNTFYLHFVSVTSGRNEIGHTFNEALINFDDMVMRPWTEFIRNVFRKCSRSITSM
jgi:hypothetical protein